MNKVLEFRILGEPTQKSSDSSLVQEQQSAIVRELIKPGLILHFYDERLIYGDIVAKDFFAMLIDSGSVTIVNEGADVTFDSMLFVKKWTDTLHRMRADRFVRLTEPKLWMVWPENIDDYLMQVLSSIGIRIGIIAAEDVVTFSVMDQKDADIFHAEDIFSIWDGGYYACRIDDADGEGMDFVIDHFASSESIPLLYLLCHAYQGYFGNGGIVDDEQIHIELDRCEHIHVHSTQIPFSLFQEIILAGIKWKSMLYSNFTPDMCIKKFYEDMVYPLLSEEYLTGEFEE